MLLYKPNIAFYWFATTTI